MRRSNRSSGARRQTPAGHELENLARSHPTLADVRVMGLYCGVQISLGAEPGSARLRTHRLVNDLRKRGVLLGG